MCEPVSISMAIAGTQLVQQQMVADANNKFNKTQAETARQRANKDAAFQAEGVIRRRVEARESLAAEAVNVTREALKASGIARAGGSAGGSVSKTLANLASQEVTNRAAVTRRSFLGDSADTYEFEAINRQAYNRALAAQKPIQPGVGIWDVVFGLGGAALSGYASTMGGPLPDATTGP